MPGILNFMMFKIGDMVKWLCPDGYYVYGKITIANVIRYGSLHSKVLFDEPPEWNYDYYRNDELEITSEAP